jgi:hypothetical protein
VVMISQFRPLSCQDASRRQRRHARQLYVMVIISAWFPPMCSRAESLFDGWFSIPHICRYAATAECDNGSITSAAGTAAASNANGTLPVATAVEVASAGRSCVQFWYFPREHQPLAALNGGVGAAVSEVGLNRRAVGSFAERRTTEHRLGNEHEYEHEHEQPGSSSKGERESGARGRLPRVFCWVLTHPAAHATKATAVNRTWGR